MLLFWNPVFIALPFYGSASILYLLMGLIFCAMPFIKSWIAKNKKNIIYWIRFIARIIILAVFIYLLEACTSGGEF